MSILVTKYLDVMAMSLEKRSQEPSTDVWPSPIANITVANDVSGDFLLSVLHSIFNYTNDLDKLASLYMRPSRLVYLMYLFTMKPENSEIAHNRTVLAEKILQTIAILRNEDPFVESNNNLVYRALNVIDDIKFQDNLSSNYILLFKKVLAALATINEYTYFAWVGIGREFHGLYRYKGDNYLVRDYYDLTPEHWSFTEKIPWKSISIITEESEEFKPSFDFNGRMYFNSTKYYDIKRVGMVLDNSSSVDLSEEKLSEIFYVLMNVIHEARQESLSLSPNQLLLKYIKGQLHAVKSGMEVFAGNNRNIEFPDNILDNILIAKEPSSFSETLKSLRYAKTREERLQILKEYLDPCNIKKNGKRNVDV